MTDLMIYLACVLLLAGSVFALLAAVGVLRLPDLLTRMHAASKAGVVGGGMILLAVGILSFDGAVALRAVLGIGFLLLTTPLSAHLLSRTAYRSKEESNLMATNELKSGGAQQAAETPKH